MKFQGLIFSVQSVFAIIFIVVVFSFGIVALNSLIANYRTQQIKSVINTIDNALQLYAKNHRAVLPSTFQMSETSNHTDNLKFKQGAVYPKDLNELGFSNRSSVIFRALLLSFKAVSGMTSTTPKFPLGNNPSLPTNLTAVGLLITKLMDLTATQIFIKSGLPFLTAKLGGILEPSAL